MFGEPPTKPLIVVVGLAASPNVGVPPALVTIVQSPVSPPPPATFPAKLAEVVVQSSWSGPAMAIVGTVFMVTVTSAKLLVQVPLLMVQRNPYEFPVVPPIAEVPGLVGERIVNAGPEICVHVPTPTIGVFPTRGNRNQ